MKIAEIDWSVNALRVTRKDLTPYPRLTTEDTYGQESVCSILALDPGETTGVSLLRLRASYFAAGEPIYNTGIRSGTRPSYGGDWRAFLDIRHGQVDCGGKSGELESSYEGHDVADKMYGASINSLGESEGVAKIYNFIKVHGVNAIVIEDFIPNFSKLTKSRAGLSPVRVTARLEQELWNRGIRVFRQSAAIAKTTMTDERLKELGMYDRAGGLNHARDADRHAITFARRCQLDRRLFRLAFPHLIGNPLVSEIPWLQEFKEKKVRADEKKPKATRTRIELP